MTDEKADFFAGEPSIILIPLAALELQVVGMDHVVVDAAVRGP